MNKLVKTKELYDCNVPYLKDLFESSEYPWEMLPKIKDLIASLLETGIEGFTLLKEGVLIGQNVKIADTVTIAIISAYSSQSSEVSASIIIRITGSVPL